MSRPRGSEAFPVEHVDEVGAPAEVATSGDDEQLIRLAYALHRVDADGDTARALVRDLARVPRA